MKIKKSKQYLNFLNIYRISMLMQKQNLKTFGLKYKKFINKNLNNLQLFVIEQGRMKC